MVLCEFCEKEIIAYKGKRFCNFMCQRKHYNRRPEIREKNRIRMKKYRRNNPEWREKHRLLQSRYVKKRRIYKSFRQLCQRERI